MKKIVAQLKPGYLVPTEEYQDTLYEQFKVNQLIVLRATRLNSEYEPSIEQNGLLHACFKLVSDNSEALHLQTPEHVKLSCKLGIGFVDPKVVIVRPDGGVQLLPRSFAFDKLRGKERNSIIEKAFEWLAETLGLTIDEMVAEAKQRMQGRI